MHVQASRDNLASLLKQHDLKVVFAESCTGGVVSATMAEVSGISNHLCGSAVTYRPATKNSWLEIPQSTMDEHTCESQQVSEAMATAVLTHTAEADWSAAVVGHLEPLQRAPFVWISIAHRLHAGEAKHDAIKLLPSHRHELSTDGRVHRQSEAASLVLSGLTDAIQESIC